MIMKNFSAIQNSPLFQGVGAPELSEMLKCLGARSRARAKGESVLSEGDPAREIGLVESGLVHVVKVDAWGNKNIIAQISSGGMFAEAFACGGADVLPVSVMAAADSVVLLLDFQKVTMRCSSACAFHSLMIRNLLGILAKKSIALQGKMEHITKRTTREKLMSYLSETARLKGSKRFEIPFDRQGLADYLSVERSALSAVMSRLKSEGAISYRKSRFEILSL